MATLLQFIRLTKANAHHRSASVLHDCADVSKVEVDETRNCNEVGDIMRIYLDIDDDGVIRDAKFKTFGCGAAIATSSMATTLIKGKTVQEALEVTNKAVMEALDGLPPVKVHCSLLAEEGIHAALWDYAEKKGIKIEGLERPVSDISEKEHNVEIVDSPEELED